MCVVSQIGDNYRDDFNRRFPNWIPNTYPNTHPNTPCMPLTISGPTRVEFDALKAEVNALRKLLEAAKVYDEETGQPDCHMDEKVDFIKKLADFVGVDMSKVFGDTK